jgi:hypothetical protein
MVLRLADSLITAPLLVEFINSLTTEDTGDTEANADSVSPANLCGGSFTPCMTLRAFVHKGNH